MQNMVTFNIPCDVLCLKCKLVYNKTLAFFKVIYFLGEYNITLIRETSSAFLKVVQ